MKMLNRLTNTMGRLREETERILSPYEAAQASRTEYNEAFGYRYRDGSRIEPDDFQYPEIWEAYAKY